MKTAFVRAPWPVKTYVVGMLLFPVALFTYGFRLYAHPANPDAWIVIGMSEVIYFIPALLILKGFNLARWVLAGLLGIGVMRIITSGLGRFHDYPELQWMLGVTMTIQVALISLVFLPQCNEHFRGSQTAEPGATDNPDDAQRLREDH